MVNQAQQGIDRSAEAKRAAETIGSEVRAAEVVAIYDKKGVGPGRLEKRGQRTLHEGSPVGSNNAEAVKPGAEVLDNLIIVGDTVLGLTRTRSAEGNRTSRIRLAVLPVGESAGSLNDMQSSATLFDIDLDELRKPRANGVVQDWEVFSFGRPEITGKTGVVDRTISSIHFGVTVMADGRVRYDDNSTNGSTIVSGRDLLQGHGAGGFEESDRRRIADFVQPLEDNPYKWQRKFEGQRVINPNPR